MDNIVCRKRIVILRVLFIAPEQQWQLIIMVSRIKATNNDRQLVILSRYHLTVDCACLDTTAINQHKRANSDILKASKVFAGDISPN